MLEDLIQELDSLNSNINEDNILDLPKLVELFTNWRLKFYAFFCEYIISGEYILKNKYDTHLFPIQLKVDQFISTLTSISIQNEVTDIIESSKVDHSLYSRSIKSLNTRLKTLLDQIEKRNNLEVHKPLFVLKDDLEDFEKNAKDINELLLPLEYHDHFLVVDNAVLNEIVKIDSKISSSSFNADVQELMHIKCHVLIKKILRRLEEDDIYSYRYIDNFNDKDLNNYLHPLHFFKDIDSSIERNYIDDYETLSSIKKQEISKELLKTLNYSPKTLTFENFQNLSKHFKDTKKDRMGLLKLFDTIKITDVSGFDSRSIFAFKTACNYIFNNIISLDKDLKNQKIRSSYYDVCDLQEVEGIKNYFPHLYYAQFIRDELDSIFKKSSFSIENTEELLKTFKNIIKEASASFKWCLDRDFQSYMLPTKDCIFKDKLSSGETKSLFIASSYVLPNNYKKVKLELDQLNIDEQKFNTLLEIYKRNLVLTEKIERTENTLNRTEKKNIEILSIFAAIVLFVTGEVQMFQFITDAHLAIYFTIAFAFSLSLFSVLIWLITRDNFRSENFGLSRSLIVLILAVSTFYAFYYLTKNDFPTQPKIEEYNDAIKKIENLEKELNSQKDIIDSLTKKN